MTLDTPVPIRFHTDHLRKLEDEAARAGLPLSTYVREQIERDTDLQSALTALHVELNSLRAELEELRSEGGNLQILLLEALLLLRVSSGPECVKIVQGELKRHGHTPHDLEKDV